MTNKVPVRRGRKNTVQEEKPAVTKEQKPAVKAAEEAEKAEEQPLPKEEAPPVKTEEKPAKEEMLLPEHLQDERPRGTVVSQDTMRIPAYLQDEEDAEVRTERAVRTERESAEAPAKRRKLTKKEARRLRDEEAWKKQAELEQKEREELEERQRRVEEEQRRIREEARERMENLDAAEKRLIERESRFEAEVEKRVREREKNRETKVVVSPQFHRAKTATVVWIVLIIIALALSSILLGIRNDRLRNELLNAQSAATEEAETENAQNASGGESAEGSTVSQTAGTRAVYLTFDDGPSTVTAQVLDILKENDIKATFFVVGRVDEASEQIYKRIVDEGHTLAMHSYTHNYSQLYESLDSFQADLHRLQNYLYEVTGTWSTIYRFPGGSSNSAAKADMKELAEYLEREHITYYDWNVYGGDDIPPEAIVSNIKANVGKYEEAIVLLHDASDKEETVEALPDVIAYINSLENTVFLPITEDTKPVQHGDTP